jgi:hypothetical protein
MSVKEMLKGTQIKANMRDRVNAITLIPDNVAREADAIVGNFTALKPVKAVTDTGKLLFEGVLDFVQRQADITRRWIPSKK